jgi:hypothetical protein
MSCQDKVQTAETIKIHPKSKVHKGIFYGCGYAKFNLFNKDCEIRIFNIPIPNKLYNEAYEGSKECVLYRLSDGKKRWLDTGRNMLRFFTTICNGLDTINAEKLKYRLEHFTH